MEYAGIDLVKRESQTAIITEAGELVEKWLRIERGRCQRFLVDRPKSRISLEDLGQRPALQQKPRFTASSGPLPERSGISVLRRG